MISGLLPVDKPLGLTSHDVVARLRRLAGQRQVGHAGTLDPLASGVLVLVLGSATRLSPYVMDSPKVYCAEVVLGATTVTDDGEAPLLERHPVASITREQITQVVQRFVGSIEQRPPLYAAVKQGGEKLYVLARRGVTVEPAPRAVTIMAIDVLAWDAPRLCLRIRCGAGTYIRSLARDIGEALGVGGYLHALRRVASGGFTVGRASLLDALTDQAAVRRAVVPGDWALAGWPAVVLSPEQETAVRAGRRIRTGQAVPGQVRLYDRNGRLAGLGRGVGNAIQPFRVFPEE